MFKHINNFAYVLPNVLDRRIYETKRPTHVSFFSSFYFSCNFFIRCSKPSLYSLL